MHGKEHGEPRLGRRELLKTFLPGGWIPELVRNGSLSPTGAKSLGVDLLLYAPSVLASCTPPKIETTPITNPEDQNKKELQGEIDRLPDSYIKTLLVAKIKPYYGQNPPKTTAYDGIEVPIAMPSVEISSSKNLSVDGTFNPKTDNNFEELHPLKDAILKAPIPYLLLPEEITKYHNQLAPDNSLLVEIPVSPDSSIFSGLSPKITLVMPDRNLVLANQYNSYRRFALIKEACSHLIFDLWQEEFVKRLRTLGIDTHIPARRKDGSTTSVEIVSAEFGGIYEQKKRTTALIDIGGYILAMKAFEKTDVMDPKNMVDPNARAVLSRIKTLTLGNNSQQLLQNLFRWILAEPAAANLKNTGNLKLLP